MIQRVPNDPAWYRGGLWHDNMPINIPGFWFMSWYDVSVGPNLAAYNYVRRTAKPEIADQQYAIIAPTLHCAHKRATEDTVVGERSVGDARLDYDSLTYGWLDHFLKGENNDILSKMPKVRYFTMGMNKWQSSDTWPPKGAEPMTLFLASGGKANSLYGDGSLASAPPGADHPDSFSYDPMNPVPSYGGNVCCTGNAITAGAFDQRKQETRADILVYSSEAFKEGLEVSGPIDVPSPKISSVTPWRISPSERPSAISDSFAHDSMLMKPGATARPSALTSIKAEADPRSPIAVTRSPRMPTSARTPGAPVPSYTRPRRMITS